MRVTAVALLMMFAGLSSAGQRMYGEQSNRSFPKFPVDRAASADPTSEYFHLKVRSRILAGDTSLTPEQVLSPTRFQNTVKGFDPGKLDELAGRLYKLNEEKEYDKAIEEGRKLIEMSPTNLTGHKELALALKNTGKDSLSDLHFGVMVKIIKSIFMYGDGTYKWPFIVNNFFEGFSIYEAVYRSRPNKYTLMLDKHGRLLAAYNAYSSALDEFLFGTRTCRIGSHF